MDIDKDTEKKIQELQVLEQNLQQLLMQKQAFQMELSETENAEHEIDKASDDVYKITGQIMIKAGKEDLKKELQEKKHLLNLRLKAIEKQENTISGRVNEFREEIVGKLSKDKKETHKKSE